MHLPMNKTKAIKTRLAFAVPCIALGVSTFAAGPQAQFPIQFLHDVVIGTGIGQELHAEVAPPKTIPNKPMPVMLSSYGDYWVVGTHKSR